MVVYDPEYERLIQFMSDPKFNLESVYNKILNLKELKTKLSLRTFTNEDFYANLSQMDSEDAEAFDVMTQRDEPLVIKKSLPKSSIID